MIFLEHDELLFLSLFFLVPPSSSSHHPSSPPLFPAVINDTYCAASKTERVYLEASLSRFFFPIPPSLSLSRFLSFSTPSLSIPPRLLAPRRFHSFLRLVEKSSVVNGNSGFIVPRQTMPGNIIKTFRRNILTLTHRFTVRQTFRSSTPPLRLRPRLSVTARLPPLVTFYAPSVSRDPLPLILSFPPVCLPLSLSLSLFPFSFPFRNAGESAIQPAR